MVGDLVGTRAEFAEGELGLFAAGHVDDPEAAAVAALRRARELRIEPVERPVEGHGLGPLESLERRVVVGAIGEQELPRLLEGGHERSSRIYFLRTDLL